jgi:hypothetical protein
MVDMIELAVKEVASSDGADADLFLDPVRALPGDRFLVQSVAQLQLFFLDPIGFRLRSVRVQAFYETGFAEEEAESGNLFKRLSEPGVSVYSEISRDDGEVRMCSRRKSPTQPLLRLSRMDDIGNACASNIGHLQRRYDV